MKLNVVSGEGDPNNPKTWSKTPKNIIDELIKVNAFESGFESSSNNLFFRITKKLLKGYYKFSLKNTSARPFLRRALRKLDAMSVVSHADKSLSKNILHFGTITLPIKYKPKDQKHYLFTDSTWNLWSSQCADRHKLSDKVKLKIDEIELLAYSQMDHIFSISEYVKDNLISHYNVPEDKVTVVGTGTGVIKPYFGDKDYNNKKILFVAKGRFIDKGGDLVIQSFKQALKSMPDLQLTIVGQRDYAFLEPHPNITTHGFLPLGELQEIFNTHSIFLMPALNEPWGLVYIEAMLCKMPIIGLNKNSFPEISGKGMFGYGLDSTDPLGVAEKLIEIINDSSRNEQIGLAAQEFALKNYTWGNTVNKIVTKISDLDSE